MPFHVQVLAYFEPSGTPRTRVLAPEPFAVGGAKARDVPREFGISAAIDK